MRDIRLLEIGDESVLETVTAARLGEVRRGPHGENPTGVHQRDPVAAGGLVHEVRRYENRHALVAGEIDQKLPESVARERVDARGRLVENEDLRRVHDRDGERQTLADAERQIGRALIKVAGEPETVDKFLNADARLLALNVEQARVQVDVLADRQLRVEGKRLRHIAHAKAGVHIGRIERLAEQKGLPGARRQKAGQHLHCRCFATSVRAKETEDLSPPDGEADAVDRGEVAEPARQVARHDDWLPVRALKGRNRKRLAAAPPFLGQQRDESLFDGRRLRFRFETGRRSSVEHAPRIHRDETVKLLGLLHIGRRGDDAHCRTRRAHARDEAPELAARERIDARRRLIQDQEVRIVNERAAEPELLTHAARKLARQPVGKRIEPRRIEQFGDAAVAFVAGLAEKAAEKGDILPHAEVGIKVLA